MIENQRIEAISAATLLARVQAMQAEGYRLVQICCTRLVTDQEVSYSFDRDGTLVTLRVPVPIRDPELPSVSSFYWSAFLYENEMHDLFGVTVRGMAVDYQGNLFNTRVPTPFVTKEPDHGE